MYLLTRFFVLMSFSLSGAEATFTPGDCDPSMVRDQYCTNIPAYPQDRLHKMTQGSNNCKKRIDRKIAEIDNKLNKLKDNPFMGRRDVFISAATQKKNSFQAEKQHIDNIIHELRSIKAGCDCGADSEKKAKLGATKEGELRSICTKYGVSLSQ
jgi:hypothetical protein